MIMPITLLTGYLGAGKTSLMNNILRNTDGYKVAVIVNDIGEVNVDTDLIAKDGQVTMEDDSLVPLQNGCICCTLKLDLVKQIVSLINMNRFDHILIEASGVCEPLPIAQSISMIDGTYDKKRNMPALARLDNIVTVVDAHRMVTEFSGASALMKENIEEDDIENLLIQQLEFCNTIVLNKVDMISEDDKKQILAVIKAIQPTAKIIESNYCKVDCAEILDTHAFSLEEAEKSAGWAQALNEPEENEESGETDEYGISTFIYRQRRPFSLKRFSEYAQKDFPSTVIRCKGPLWFKEEPQNAYMFEQAGQEIIATPFGSWIAANNIVMQKAMLKKHPEIKDDWDETYGDRRVELVFIGKDMDKDKIIKDLDALLEN